MSKWCQFSHLTIHLEEKEWNYSLEVFFFLINHWLSSIVHKLREEICPYAGNVRNPFHEFTISLHQELKCSWVQLHNCTGPCLCISTLCSSSSDNRNTRTSFHQQHNSYKMKPHRFDGVTEPATTVLFVVFKLLSFKWLGQEGNGPQSVSGPHASYEQFLCPKSIICDVMFLLLNKQVATLNEDLLLHPGLWVDGPVDDVKEDVRSRKHNPRVLVYGVGVYPNVHVASGWLHLACDLRVIQRHLSKHSLLAAAVLWHPIIPCGVYVHRPVASDLRVDHHLIRVANAACTRQLERRQKVPLNSAYCKRCVLQSHPTN